VHPFTCVLLCVSHRRAHRLIVASEKQYVPFGGRSPEAVAAGALNRRDACYTHNTQAHMHIHILTHKQTHTYIDTHKHTHS